MFHYINNFEDLATGKVVTSVMVRLLDPVTGDQIQIHADENGTPYANRAGVVTNDAEVNDKGRIDFWVRDGTYDFAIIAASGAQLDYIRKINMVGDVSPDALNARDQALAAAASAVTAAGQSEADALQTAADRLQTGADVVAAQAAVDAAALAGNIYPDTAAGLAGTVEGEYFTVAQIGSSYLMLYRKVSGAAALVNSYPSRQALDAAVGYGPILDTRISMLPSGVIGASAKFPDFNGQYLGAYGLFSQSTTNFGNWFGTTGCLFVEIEIPQERMLDPREFYIFGNGNFSGGNTVTLRYHGDNYLTDPSRRGRFGMFINNAAYNIFTPQIPKGVKRALIYAARISNDWSLKLLDIDTGVLYSGESVNCSALSGVSSFSGGQVLIGDARNNSAERSTWSIGQSAWTGSIGRIGYTTDSVTDADFEAIRNGADPILQFGGATIRWYRKLNELSMSLQPVPAATADSTVATAAFGAIGIGGHIVPSGKITLNKAPDGLCYAAKPGVEFSLASVGGRLRDIGSADVVEMRLLSESKREIVRWTPVAFIPSGATSWTGTLTAPICAEWCIRQVRLRSDPTNIFLDGSFVSIGAGIVALGQSQMNNMMSRNSLGRLYNGQAPASVCETQTVSGVRAQRLRRLGLKNATSDGLAAAAEQFAKLYGGGQMWITDGVPNSSLQQWIDDDESSRLWSDWIGALQMGEGQISTAIFPWFTAIRGADVAALHLDPTFLGRGPNAQEHWFFEDGAAPAGTTVVLFPGSRENVVGTFAYDADQLSGVARAAIRSWVAAHPEFALIGPEQVTTLVDQYHPANTIEGDVWFGMSLGIGAAIGMRVFTLREMYVDTASVRFISADRTAFGFDVVTPLNKAIRNSLGWTFRDAAEDRSVGFIEVSTDAGATWAYLPATAAQITGRFRVTVTNPAGSWSTGLRVRIGKGGPGAYGVDNADGNLHAQKYWLYDGDERCINGFGNPMRLSDNAYTVADA